MDRTQFQKSNIQGKEHYLRGLSNPLGVFVNYKTMLAPGKNKTAQLLV